MFVPRPTKPTRPPPCRWRGFTRALTVAIVASAAVAPVGNVVVDPYEVFGTGIVRIGSTANERVMKTRFLLRRVPYERLLIGSSVTGVIEPEALGSHSYNGSFFAATPSDVLKTLQLLHREGRLPPDVLIGIDPFMMAAPVKHAPQVRLPPETTGESPIEFWLDYAFAPSGSAIIAKVVEAMQPEPGVEFHLSSGSYRLARFERELAADPAAYGRARVWSVPIPVTPQWLDPLAVADLTALSSWSRTVERSRFTYFVPPLHPRIRASLGADGTRFSQILHEQFGDSLIDLSSSDGIVDPSRDYFDVKHFSPASGARVAQALLTRRSEQSIVQAAR